MYLEPIFVIYIYTYIYDACISPYFSCDFLCLYFNCFDIFFDKKGKNIEYLTHLK